MSLKSGSVLALAVACLIGWAVAAENESGVEKVDKKNLPASVVNSIEKAYPGSTIAEVEKKEVKQGKSIKITYEVGITTAQNEKLELAVTKSGKITAAVPETGDKGENETGEK